MGFWETLVTSLPGLDLDAPDEKYNAIYHPTRDFSLRSPGITGMKHLCERCLTLLERVTYEFGEGKQLYASVMAHSIFRLDPARKYSISNFTDSDKLRLNGFVKRMYEPQACVICRNTKILLDNNKSRDTSNADVRISWTLQSVDPVICFRTKFPLDCIQVRIEAKQHRQYSVTLGSFNLWTDGAVDVNGISIQDNPVIIPLDGPSTASSTSTNVPNSTLQPDFMSTCGPSTFRIIADWMHECRETHGSCAPSSNIHTTTPADWIPGRLIYITTRASASGSPVLHARIVEKSNASDFPPRLSSSLSSGVDKESSAHHPPTYLSLSHCWGPTPKRDRGSSVLTAKSLSSWKVTIPFADVSTTARQAIQLTHLLGFEYAWIDSLCIVQDSVEDWKRESATMGDVYRRAWANITALWSRSDEEGFLNFDRDPRVDFGWRAELPRVLGIQDPEGVRNERGERCKLLQGEAWFTWDNEPAHGGCARGPAALLERAWVFQERHLAKRMIAFSDKTVYWSCNEANRCENNKWDERKYASPALHQWQSRVAALRAAQGSKTDDELDAELTTETAAFWTDCVKTYTESKLTKPSDRLIALASIAQEVSSVGAMSRVQYLAGLFDYNLEDQLLWFTKRERTVGPETRIFVPPRKFAGEEDYSAPTWSWASLHNIPISPGTILHSSSGRIIHRVAYLIDADVRLTTDFAFGLVSAGYLRMRGRLLRIGSMGFTSPNNPWIRPPPPDDQSPSRIYFAFDTSADLETVRDRRSQGRCRWLPIRVDISKNTIECRGLVIVETDEYRRRGREGVGTERRRGEDDVFVKPGDKVYRRLGFFNFGRSPESVRQDPLLLREVSAAYGLLEDEFEELVLT